MSSSAATRRQNLEKLRSARNGQKRTYDDTDRNDDIYDEVNEDEFKQVVRGRLLEQDFVVDDNGLGYADDGRDAWDHTGETEGESEEEQSHSRKKKKSKQAKDEKLEKQRNAMNKFLTKQAASRPKKIVQTATGTDKADDAEFLNDILNGIDTTPASNRKSTTTTTTSRFGTFSSTSKKPARLTELTTPTPSTRVNKDVSRLDLPELESDDVPHGLSSPSAQQKKNTTWSQLDSNLDNDQEMTEGTSIEDSDKSKESSVTAISMEGISDFDPDEDESMEVQKPLAANLGTDVQLVNISSSKPVPSRPAIVPKLESTPVKQIAKTLESDESREWIKMNDSIQLASSPATQLSVSMGKIPVSDVADENGTVKMFWTDYCEVNNTLVLFGKVKAKGSDNYVSSMVQVSGIMRKLYFLPRTHRRRDGHDTDEEVQMEDVYNEVDEIFHKSKIAWKSKPCQRKYAFDLPDIPHESTYLEVLYPYSDKQLQSDLQGETFSHVFGTYTRMFEQFVLLRRVMGPCFLEIKNIDTQSAANISWCKIEMAVDNPMSVTPLDDTDAPPFTIMSLALRTVLNPKDNKQEIVAISGRVFTNVKHDTTQPMESLKPYVFTIVRPINHIYPPGFESEIKRNGRGTIHIERNEQAVLNNFLARVQRFDPDVFIGHNLDSVDLSTLLHRMKILKTPNWHRMGRLRRSEWPGNSFFTDKIVASGRLLCDLANDHGKSMMPKCQSWSLTEMCSVVLGMKTPRPETEEINLSKSSNWTDKSENLLQYLKHCEIDTHFIATLALKIQILPLTKQLTNLAGNSWARTLSGTRSERNEYILLHEFIRNKYIVPDKLPADIQKKNRRNFEDDDDQDDETVGSKKKDKYKGGLVFEPEKGLYDKYILVMDFNSLYPSIIQEYNICFTTVDRSKCSESDSTVPDPPSTDVGQGILPRLIATLVQRRRQVKNLMKDKKATSTQIAQWDIKQQALKLTANSMYGCLGYTKSRFYARPLAMLTTYKGREILTNTKELAESLQLKVVYGDTDSVMINTNCESYDEAINIGQEFKKAVNERYRLLEIDIDNVFQRLLMHAKKKYAALNCIDVNGTIETQVEVKGLDMRRREYCSLSKEASSYVLNCILSGEQTETVVEKIHEYLRELTTRVNEDQIPFSKFIIYTKLSKAPEQYQGGKTMPPVQAALKRKARGENVLPNDVIGYIITAGEGNNPAERAFPPGDVFKTDSGLIPDHEFYLAKQILPPIERLCGTINGTDSAHLANCLGLDVRKYQIITGNSDKQNAFDLEPLESTIPDNERFQDSERFLISCSSCSNRTEFAGIMNSKELCTAKGLECSNCHASFGIASVIAQLELNIRKTIVRYYDGWVVCDDSSCGNRTRQISVYGKRCIGRDGLAKSCRGVMQYEFSDKQLYNQLLYLDSLFNVDKSKGLGDTLVDALAEHNRTEFETVRGVVNKYLSDCGRRYVDFRNIFDF
ncbi:hypothetical protein V1514DRAFT_337844 [Lipomyces japonicus]|uniref:uncharacterized protein n=1 Tax=Lipomyces japonicus TaxID=56871 RepID=UPI0034CD8164